MVLDQYHFIDRRDLRAINFQRAKSGVLFAIFEQNTWSRLDMTHFDES